jgi:hypothetical protein
MDNKRFEPPIARAAKPATSAAPAPANTLNQEVPRDVLGIPGAYYQLWVHNIRRGEDPHSKFHSQEDKYRVVFTLSRHPLDKQNLDFKGAGDSFIKIAKPEGERTENDADRVVIFSVHFTPTGVEKIEVEGIPNKEGRLAQCVVELSAPSFAEADRIAFGAVSGFFSTLAFEIDVPVRLGQLNIEQTSTQNASMTYTCPYPDVHLTAAGTDLSQNPYIQSLLSLYREGINSNSMNYQFLCWYKVVEGINWERTKELSAEPATGKKALALQIKESLPPTKEEMRKLVADTFPLLDPAGVKDERWDHLAPDEVLGRRFNRVRQDRLEEIRNKIAHMLTDKGGDLSLSPDTHSHRAEVTRWISLLRLMARIMIRNEKARLPRPPGVFVSPPEAGDISQWREQFRKA